MSRLFSGEKNERIRLSLRFRNRDPESLSRPNRPSATEHTKIQTSQRPRRATSQRVWRGNDGKYDVSTLATVLRRVPTSPQIQHATGDRKVNEKLRRTEEIILNNNGVIRIHRAPKYGSIEFDLWKSNYKLNEEGMETALSLLRQHATRTPVTTVSHVSGSRRMVSTVWLKDMTEKLRVILEDPKFLVKLEGTVERSECR